MFACMCQTNSIVTVAIAIGGGIRRQVIDIVVVAAVDADDYCCRTISFCFANNAIAFLS